MTEPAYPEHLLHAYVDGELAAEEAAIFLAALQHDEALRARVGELRALKEMVRLAYGDVAEAAPAEPHIEPRWRRPVSLTIAACLVVAVAGGLLSWQLDALSPLPATGIAHAEADALQVVFHLSSAESDAAAVLLDQVELVLEQYLRAGRPLRVEVVANNSGLDAYRLDRSPVSSRISRIYARYPNIVFAACGRTLERVRERAGAVPALLPEVIVVDSGVAEVSRRQRQGWLYIRT